jgi:hypothetical protein
MKSFRVLPPYHDMFQAPIHTEEERIAYDTRWYQRKEELNDLADQVCNTYKDFVRLARRKLAV